MERPVLKPWYRLSTNGGRSVLRYAGSVLEFEGRAAQRLLPQLLPLLDGTRTVDEVVAAIGEGVRPAIEHALSLLRAHELLTEPVPADAADGARRCAELLAATDPAARSGAELAAGLAAMEAYVVGAAPAAEAVGRLLRQSGAGAVEGPGWGDPPPARGLTVVAPPPARLPRAPAWEPPPPRARAARP